MRTVKTTSMVLALSLLAVPLTSCSAGPAPASGGQASSASAFVKTEIGTFDEPWAMAFVPGTSVLLVTEKGGKIKGVDTRNDRTIFVIGGPEVDYGGQGGLGDIAFLPGEAASTLTPRTIFLSWVEAGSGSTRGAVVGRGRLICEEHQTCDIRDLNVIWRQSPKVGGRGHYSHRIAFSPDGKHMFVASGDRQAMAPAQDLGGNLGKIVRLNLDGTPAAGNPFAARGGTAAQLWTLGHRNILGLAFDGQGRLWDLEHGPAGGDELNLVKPGANYGWPVVSEGDHYDGKDIPPHSSRPDIAAPAITWTPVIAPGGMIIYSGDGFPAWKGQALIAGMTSEGLVRVAIDGERAREVERMPMGKRIRAITQAPDGAVWVIEDKGGARLFRLTPK